MKNFDEFNTQARIIPALIVALPIYLYLIMYNIININFIEIMGDSFLFIILISVFYRYIRNLGKEYEKKMYKKLGGMPTTLILRYSDNRIDEITKTRYHKVLNNNIEDLNLPTRKEEETIADDKAYESAIIWLRNYANNHRETETRVYQELKDYNFWRNLYGGRNIIDISCIICMIIETIKIYSFDLENITQVYNNFINVLIMFFVLIISNIIIKEENVFEKAFDYAKTLLEVCERL